MGKEINAFELIAKKGVREVDEMRNLLMAYEVFLYASSKNIKTNEDLDVLINAVEELKGAKEYLKVVFAKMNNISHDSESKEIEK